MSALAVTAAVALGLVVYSYVVYPVLLFLAASAWQGVRDLHYLKQKEDRRASRTGQLPAVAVVVSAYNECEHILRRVQNVLASEYPADLLRLYVGSDGSTDGTSEVLATVSDPRVVARCFERNRGKASVLNDLVAGTTEPIIVFSDANTDFAPDAIVRLVRHFEDSRVGCASGELRLAGSSGDSQEGAYWRFEQALKFLEARIGGLLGANGAIYAIRREFWTPLRADTICDDFCVAMGVAARRSQLVYDPEALAFEDTPPGIGDEYSRRVRIGIGNFQALVLHPEYLTRTSWVTRWTYFSHKVLRWLTPHLVAVAILCSCLQWADPWWRTFALLQLESLAVAMLLHSLALRTAQGRGLWGTVRPLAHLVALNVAFLVASYRFATGRYSGSWRRTARQATAAQR